MLRCIAIDDEELALELLEDNISKIPFLQLEGKCKNALEALELLHKIEVDLIFLDIQMPGLTGLQFLQALPNRPMCILVTAYDKYALQAFDLNVIDYLLKPVSLERFIRASTKALELHLLKEKHVINNTAEPNHLFINVDYSLLKVVFTDILWVEGLRDYIKIHLTSSPKPIVTRLSMKAIEDQLPSSLFLRIHKSYIISREQVTAIRRNTVFIGSNEFPVGDNYKDIIPALIGNRPPPNADVM